MTLSNPTTQPLKTRFQCAASPLPLSIVAAIPSLVFLILIMAFSDGTTVGFQIVVAMYSIGASLIYGYVLIQLFRRLAFKAERLVIALGFLIIGIFFVTNIIHTLTRALDLSQRCTRYSVKTDVFQWKTTTSCSPGYMNYLAQGNWKYY
ncbi:MAG: hypothetical protein WCO52_00765 [bacterium]